VNLGKEVATGYALPGGGHRVAWTSDGTITPLAADLGQGARSGPESGRGLAPRPIERYLAALGAVLDWFVTQRRFPRRDEPRDHRLVLIFADQPRKPVLTYSVDSSFGTLWRWYPVKR